MFEFIRRLKIEQILIIPLAIGVISCVAYTATYEKRIAELERWREEVFIHIPAMEECEPGDWLCEPEFEEESDGDEF